MDVSFTFPASFTWNAWWFPLLGLIFVGCILLSFLVSQFTSPLRNLRCPPSPSWLYGHLLEILRAEHPTLHEKWFAQYGTTIRFKEFFGVSLFLSDLQFVSS